MASVDLTTIGSYEGADRAARLASVEAALTKVLSLRPDDPRAHMHQGWLQVDTNRVAEGIAEFERALALDPNLAEAQAGLGNAML